MDLFLSQFSPTPSTPIKKLLFNHVFNLHQLVLKTEDAIIQTGNGIISPASSSPVEKFLLQNVLSFTKDWKTGFKIGNGIISSTFSTSAKLVLKTGNGINSPSSCPDLQSKKFFYKTFPIFTTDF